MGSYDNDWLFLDDDLFWIEREDADGEEETCTSSTTQTP